MDNFLIYVLGQIQKKGERSLEKLELDIALEDGGLSIQYR